MIACLALVGACGGGGGDEGPPVNPGARIPLEAAQTVLAQGALVVWRTPDLTLVLGAELQVAWFAGGSPVATAPVLAFSERELVTVVPMLPAADYTVEVAIGATIGTADVRITPAAAPADPRAFLSDVSTEWEAVLHDLRAQFLAEPDPIRQAALLQDLGQAEAYLVEFRQQIGIATETELRFVAAFLASMTWQVAEDGESVLSLLAEAVATSLVFSGIAVAVYLCPFTLLWCGAIGVGLTSLLLVGQQTDSKLNDPEAVESVEVFGQGDFGVIELISAVPKVLDVSGRVRTLIEEDRSSNEPVIAQFFVDYDRIRSAYANLPAAVAELVHRPVPTLPDPPVVEERLLDIAQLELDGHTNTAQISLALGGSGALTATLRSGVFAASTEAVFRYPSVLGMIEFQQVFEVRAATGWTVEVLAPGTANAVSDNGTVVVGTRSDPSYAAFRWTVAGGIETLSGPGMVNGFGYGISADGRIVVGSGIVPATLSGHYQYVYRWSQVAGGNVFGPHLSSGLAVSDDGNIIVGRAPHPQGGSRAAYWDDFGGPIAVPAAGNDRLRVAEAVSADGTVMVGNVYGSTRWFRWDGGATATLIDAPVGYTSASVGGMSSDGTEVAGTCAGSVPGETRAFRWSTTQGYELIEPGPLSQSSAACGITPGGDAVVGWVTRSSGERAFLWTPAGELQDLGAGRAHAVAAGGAVVVGESGGYAVVWRRN
ncbi:MAG: hypothetical protein KDE27_01015 [Planctomycetes bacterium]|nr:hypothetical protein [Planctomycetota bacterium]